MVNRGRRSSEPAAHPEVVIPLPEQIEARGLRRAKPLPRPPRPQGKRRGGVGAGKARMAGLSNHPAGRGLHPHARRLEVFDLRFGPSTVRSHDRDPGAGSAQHLAEQNQVCLLPTPPEAPR